MQVSNSVGHRQLTAPLFLGAYALARIALARIFYCRTYRWGSCSWPVTASFCLFGSTALLPCRAAYPADRDAEITTILADSVEMAPTVHLSSNPFEWMHGRKRPERMVNRGRAQQEQQQVQQEQQAGQGQGQEHEGNGNGNGAAAHSQEQAAREQASMAKPRK